MKPWRPQIYVYKCHMKIWTRQIHFFFFQKRRRRSFRHIHYAWSNKHFAIEKVENWKQRNSIKFLNQANDSLLHFKSWGFSTTKTTRFLDLLHLPFPTIQFFLVLFLHIWREREREREREKLVTKYKSTVICYIEANSLCYNTLYF